jgi:TusA-related sulfurtransferase
MTEHRLDITSEVCPMTFVKTKLLLERMAPGDTAEVRLKGAEPRDNVPRSVRDHGYEVLALDVEAGAGGDGEIYLLRIRKR